MPKHALRRRRRNRRIFCNLIDGGAAPVPAQVQVWYQNRRQRERSQGTKGAAEMLVRRAHDGVPIRAPARDGVPIERRAPSRPRAVKSTPRKLPGTSSQRAPVCSVQKRISLSR